jgi:hypothetical protein
MRRATMMRGPIPPNSPSPDPAARSGFYSASESDRVSLQFPVNVIVRAPSGLFTLKVKAPSATLPS